MLTLQEAGPSEAILNILQISSHMPERKIFSSSDGLPQALSRTTSCLEEDFCLGHMQLYLQYKGCELKIHFAQTRKTRLSFENAGLGRSELFQPEGSVTALAPRGSRALGAGAPT